MANKPDNTPSDKDKKQAKRLSFKDYVVGIVPVDDDLLIHNSKKLRMYTPTGNESVQNKSPQDSVLETFVADQTDLEEVLSLAGRRAKGRMMKKNKARTRMGARKASKKMADIPRLKSRAKKQARNAMFKKLSKGKSREQMGPAQRAAIEKRLNKMKGRIDTIAKKSLPAVRRMAQVRLRKPKK